MFSSSLNRECDTLGNCFVLAGQDGWDTKDFVNKLFKTSWGKNILTGKAVNEYACDTFMYEGLKRECKKKDGTVLPKQVLWFCGYLYRYLIANTNIKPSQIYKIVNIDLLNNRWGFYHTQDWEYIKEDLLSDYNSE